MNSNYTRYYIELINRSCGGWFCLQRCWDRWSGLVPWVGGLSGAYLGVSLNRNFPKPDPHKKILYNESCHAL